MEKADAVAGERGAETSFGFLLPMIRGIDQINERVGRASSWLALLLVLVTAYDVIMRYLFRMSFVFIQELEWHLFAILFLIAAGYTHLYDGHVRVDIFYARMSARGRALVDLVFGAFFLFPTCFLLIKTSIPFVLSSWAVLEGSPDPGGMPARYLLKAAIPIAFLSLALQGISDAIKKVFLFLGKEFHLEREVRQ